MTTPIKTAFLNFMTMAEIPTVISFYGLRRIERKNESAHRRLESDGRIESVPAPPSAIGTTLDSVSLARLSQKDPTLRELLITEGFFLKAEERKGRFSKARDRLEALSLVSDRSNALWLTVHKELLRHRHVKNLEIHYVTFANRKWLRQVLCCSPRLTRLALFGNAIGDSGAYMIAKGLARNHTLTHLSLDSNQISDFGAIHLATALSTNDTLLDLSLRYNFITDHGARDLATSIETNTKLKRMDLSHNCIPTGGNLIPRALEQNTALTEFAMEYNRRDIYGMSAFGTTLKNNTALRILRLSGNRMGPCGAFSLASGLSQNTTLKELHLDRNLIGLDGLLTIIKALETNKSLEVLSFCGMVGPASATRQVLHDALLRVLQSNTVIREIRASGDSKIVSEECAIYLNLNRGLRKILNDDKFPPSLWPLVCKRAAYERSSTHRLNLLFYVIQQKIEVFCNLPKEREQCHSASDE
jgi:hypothetical protein